MSEGLATNALLAAPEKPLPPAAQQIVDVARDHGVNPFRQFAQILRLMCRKYRVDPHEYYSNGCYRPDLSLDQKLQFVGTKGSARLNARMSPLRLTQELRVFVRDKIYYNSMIAQLGFRTCETQAVVSRDRCFGNIPALRDIEAITSFLLNDARYPLFTKPQEGSKSVGSALLDGIDKGSGQIRLANGASIDVTEFATEVLREYPEGFLLQSAVRQHPDISAVIGAPVGTIRVVTVMDDAGPKPLYALWKIPSPTAMSDNFWQSGSLIAELDSATGQVVQCRKDSGPAQHAVSEHPVSGVAVADMKIPFWQDVIDTACRAHAVLPQFGVFGWDIAVTEDGPLIIECNANPFHMLYQLATGRGILNEDFMPILDNVAARAKVATAEHIKLWDKKQKQIG